jgi:acyl-CoA synthetase (NDP forming)
VFPNRDARRTNGAHDAGPRRAVSDRRPLAALLDPVSLVIIGASNDPNRVGGRPIAYSLRYGFRGRIYPVNPARREVQGLTAYPDLASLPEVPEVAMIITPGELAVEAVEDCARAGVRAAVVIASGFAEVGEEGARMQDRMVIAARASGMRLVGPNTQGLVNFTTGAMLNFSTMVRATPPPIAPIAVCSQSGSMAVVPYGLLRQRGLGVRHAHSTGNEADVSVGELAAEVVREPGLRLLLLYLETIRDTAALVEMSAIARERGVAVLAVKAGRSAPGQAAARSHTGALANEDRVVDAFFERHGILRVHDSEELVLAAELYLKDWDPRGSRTVVLSQSGASCVQAVDAAVELGLPLAELTSATSESLAAILPSFAVTTNPIDLTGALVNDNTLFSKVLPVLARDAGVDATVIVLPLISEGYDLKTLSADAGVQAERGPVVAGIVDPAASEAFRAAGVPTFPTEVTAVRALHQYLSARALMSRTTDGVRLPPTPTSAGRPLHEAAALDLLARYGVPVVTHRLCRSEEEAVLAMGLLEGPVALKGCSRLALHKSELGLVRLGLDREEDLRSAYRDVSISLAAHDPEAAGVIVAQMTHGRHELMIGARRDPVFGPLLVIGDGGTAVEILGDVRIILLPCTAEEILVAVGSLRVAPLLGPMRGQVAVDLSGFVTAALAAAEVIMDASSEVVELDLNPVIVGMAEGAAVAVDAVVFLRSATE